MSDENDEPRPRRRAAWIVAVLICVFVLYPLSIGPAFALWDYMGNPDGPALALGIAYFPLFAVCQAAMNTDSLPTSSGGWNWRGEPAGRH